MTSFESVRCRASQSEEISISGRDAAADREANARKDPRSLAGHRITDPFKRSKPFSHFESGLSQLCRLILMSSNGEKLGLRTQDETITDDRGRGHGEVRHIVDLQEFKLLAGGDD